MENNLKTENILSQIKQLDNESIVYLMEKISKMLKRNTHKLKQTESRLCDLNSLGSEIWENINISQYIHHERQWD